MQLVGMVKHHRQCITAALRRWLANMLAALLPCAGCRRKTPHSCTLCCVAQQLSCMEAPQTLSCNSCWRQHVQNYKPMKQPLQKHTSSSSCANMRQWPLPAAAAQHSLLHQSQTRLLTTQHLLSQQLQQRVLTNPARHSVQARTTAAQQACKLPLACQACGRESWQPSATVTGCRYRTAWTSEPACSPLHRLPTSSKAQHSG